MLILGSALAALLVAEIVLRAIGYSAPVWYHPHPELGWTLRPGLATWFTGEGRGFVRVNAEGLRDRDHAAAKPAGVYRIAVLGDSYSEARQVAEEQAYWALLPERLAHCAFQPGKRIEVLNFGVSGYGTAQQYLALQSMAARYQPDLVLLQFTNGNDVRNNSPALEPEKARPFYIREGGKLRLDRSFATGAEFAERVSESSELLRAATDHSRVLQLLRASREMSLITRAPTDSAEQGLEPEVLAPPADPLWEEAWLVTEALIGAAAQDAQRHGARFLVVTVPYAIQVHPDPAARAAMQAKLGIPDLFYPDRRVGEFAARHGIEALALAPEMQRMAQASGEYFHGFVRTGMGRGHWNADGHRVAANLIARHLCSKPL